MAREIARAVLIVAGIIAAVAVATGFDPFALASSIIGSLLALAEVARRRGEPSGGK